MSNWRQDWVNNHFIHATSIIGKPIQQFFVGQKVYGTKQFQGNPLSHLLEEWGDIANYIIAIQLQQHDIIDLLTEAYVKSDYRDTDFQERLMQAIKELEDGQVLQRSHDAGSPEETC